MSTPYAWVDELKDSLIRGGHHVAADIPTARWSEDENFMFAFKLGHTIPKDAKGSFSKYIKLFAKEHGARVVKVTHSRFSVTFSVAT